MPFGSSARAHGSMVQCMKLNGRARAAACRPVFLPLIGLYRQVLRVTGDGPGRAQRLPGQPSGSCRVSREGPAEQPRPGAQIAVRRQPRFTQGVGDRLPHPSCRGPLDARRRRSAHVPPSARRGRRFQAPSGTSAGPSPPWPPQPALYQAPSRPCQLPRLASSRQARSAYSGSPAWYSRSRSETSLGSVTP